MLLLDRFRDVMAPGSFSSMEKRTEIHLFNFHFLVKAVFLIAIIVLAMRVMGIIIVNRFWLPCVIVLSLITFLRIRFVFLLALVLRSVAALIFKVIFKLFIAIVILVLLGFLHMVIVIFNNRCWIFLLHLVKEELVVMVRPARLIIVIDMLAIFKTLNLLLKL